MLHLSLNIEVKKQVITEETCLKCDAMVFRYPLI